METDLDQSGHPFKDVPTLYEHHIRVTYVAETKAGFGTASVRVQIRQDDGHLLMGPEIPLESIGSVIQTIIELIRKV